VRTVRATNPDIVYIGAYPPDNVGIQGISRRDTMPRGDLSRCSKLPLR
jgi:hypothetical protein